MNSREEKIVLTRADVEQITHYGHWIPVFRGLHNDFAAAHYPGYKWHQLIQELRNRDVFVRKTRANPYGIRKDLEEVEIPKRPAS